jgi:hypothetical protein
MNLREKKEIEINKFLCDDDGNFRGMIYTQKKREKLVKRELFFCVLYCWNVFESVPK